MRLCCGSSKAGSSKIAPDEEDDGESDGPTIRMIRCDALLECKYFKLRKDAHEWESETSQAVLEKHWHSEKKSVDDIFPREAFVDVPWAELEKTKYAVLTYSWAECPWLELITALRTKGMFGKKANLAWIDIFCLDQNAADKMETIKRTPSIIGMATEHHVMGHVRSRDTFGLEVPL